MTERLLAALDRLEEALSRIGYPLVEGLRPGLSEDEVRTRLAKLDVDPPTDIVTLFGWHDGYATPVGGDWHGRIAATYWLLTLEEACQQHPDSREALELAAEANGESAEWFPVIATDRAFLVIGYGDAPEIRGRVAVSDGGDLEPTSEKRPHSLAEPVELWAEYFESGLWRWDGSSWTDERDADQFAEHPWAI